jgi:hypothetical protein
MYRRWLKERKKENPIVNAELLKLFRHPTFEQIVQLDAMLPTKVEQGFGEG